MRRKATALLIQTFLASSLLPMVAATPAHATEPPIVFTDSVSFNDLNPCTGQRHRVMFDLTIRVHDFVTEDGRHHLTIHEEAIVTTSSGWTGSGQAQVVEIVSEDGDATFTFVLQHQLHHPDFPGQTLRPGVVIHVTVVDGEVVADIGRFRFECVGNVS
jgi:hypothetical protein